MKQSFLQFHLLPAFAVIVTATVKVAAEPPVSTDPPAVTNQMSLDDLVNEALEKNPELNFYRAEIAAAKGGYKSAGAWPNPEAGAEIGQKRVRSSSGAAWSVSLNQTFEHPGRLSLRKAIANHDVQLAELGFAQFKNALAARVRTLGYNMFIAQEKLAASREVADRLQALTEVLGQRDPAGVTPVLETRIIEAATLTLQRQADESGVAAQVALLELNHLRGQPPNAAVRVTGAQLNFRRTPALDTLLDTARTNAFELRIRQMELEQQGFKVSLAKNERFPGITVGPFISEEKAADRERIIGLGVSVPLPLWNRNTGNIETAEARAQQAQISLLVAQREIERRVTENALVLEARLDQMDKWRADGVQKFREAAELADRHYRLGAVPISTYVELQKQYLEAAEVMLKTKKESLEAAQALEQLIGLTPPLVSSKEEQK